MGIKDIILNNAKERQDKETDRTFFRWALNAAVSKQLQDESFGDPIPLSLEAFIKTARNEILEEIQTNSAFKAQFDTYSASMKKLQTAAVSADLPKSKLGQAFAFATLVATNYGAGKKAYDSEKTMRNMIYRLRENKNANYDYDSSEPKSAGPT